ncbi:MAG TPA: polysaccharide biosynthesis protein [Ruminiclostridium sp.]
MKKALVVNALILTGTALLLRTINLTFRVYISNKIGAEGMGLYQLIFSIFALASTFATSGISIAVTRLVSEEAARGAHTTVNKVLIKAFMFSLILSITASFLLFTFADYIGTAWLNDSRTVFSLKILAPSLPFIGVSSCLRGYFLAKRKIIKTASAQILEQFIKIFIVVNVINMFVTKELEYTCAAVVLGATVAEMVSCVYVFILYYYEKKKNSKYDIGIVRTNRILNKILNISLPIAASSYVRIGLNTVENIMIPSGFEKFGSSSKTALAEYGMIRGMAMPILTFPSAFLSAFSTLLIPEISEANALNHKNRINYAISRVFQLTLLLSILVAGVFISFSNELGMAIYKSKEIGAMLKLLAPLIPFMYLDRIVDGIMKGLNQQVSSLKYDIINSLCRIGMIYYLIPIKGVSGFIIVIYISSILNSFLNINRLLKVTKLKVKFVDWIFMPMLSVAASAFIVTLIFKVDSLKSLPLGISVTIGIILIIVLYLTSLLLLESITKDDISWFKNCFKNINKDPKNVKLVDDDLNP